MRELLLDYNELGLKVGLEVHQQLETKHKLFCKCPSKLFMEEPEYTFMRRLRPSQSELGEIDPAALFEFMKGKTIVYEANNETSCLVEMDEEPPGSLNEEALDICLKFALWIGSKPVDEIHVMRKIVVDGSNTTGFQRTCIVSLGGKIKTENKSYNIQQICLEEDAARKMLEIDKISNYRIDRLGISLIEVTTAPEIHSPEEAENVALAIGRLLRAMGSVKRGLGSIRQDLNISIKGGALIEIKGVQELNLIKKVVEYEAQRQAKLLEIYSELKERGINKSDVKGDFVDVTEVFRFTENNIIKRALEKEKRVIAVRLPNFAGLVGIELCPNRRLGTEMSDRAKYYGGGKGIFHTDELPAYGITKSEIDKLIDTMNASENDVVIFVADETARAHAALNAVIDRAQIALAGVPSETRAAYNDGTSHFTRPRPGAARMYPETDVKSIVITSERLNILNEKLPEMPEAKLDRFMTEYKLNEKLANQIIDSNYVKLFEEIANNTNLKTTLIAVTLTETLKSLERDGVDIGNLDDQLITEVFNLLDQCKTAKESLTTLFTWLSKNKQCSAEEAIKSLGLEMLTINQLNKIIRDKLTQERDIVNKSRKKAFGLLMGKLMSELRGRARPEDVRDILKKELFSN